MMEAMVTTDSALARSLAAWRPGRVTMTRRVDPWAAEAFAGLIGSPPPGVRNGDPLPPMWHWFTLLEHPATSEIGEDGHPADGPFLPPVPGRRRMFAGGRLTQHMPIPFGAELTATSSVTSVTVKSGRSGEMAFVTVRHELSADGASVGAEEQDIVYRSGPPGIPPRVTERTESGEPEPQGDWRMSLSTGPVLLFRFSALTYNGHRIHYDRPYVTGAEGYPDLVIHGPLLALLALELPRLHAPDRTVTSFEYRLVRPAFVPSRIVAAGTPGPGSDGTAEAALTVAATGAAPSLTAKARLA
jgi:3-methylfumaryl-CoA hydratase